MKILFIFMFLFFIFHPAYAGDFPLDKGKIIYHTYTDYSAGDSQLYMYDFESNINTNMSENWGNVSHAMNAHVSSDGKYLTFMGIHTTPNGENWDIYLWDFISTEPVNLTSVYDKRNEDPKFSPDGEKIVFKQGSWNHTLDMMQYDIKVLDLEGNIVDILTEDLEENSMPYYTNDGENIIYSKGVGANSSIYMVNVSTKQKTLLYDEVNLQEYYPVTLNDTDFYYTSWEQNSQNDQIYLGDIYGASRELLSINRQHHDFSDPYHISDNLILFSSNYESEGGYDLYVGNTETGDIWNMQESHISINSHKHELGGIFFLDNEQEQTPILNEKILKKADKLIQKYSKNSDQILLILYKIKNKNKLNDKQELLIDYLIEGFKK